MHFKDYLAKLPTFRPPASAGPRPAQMARMSSNENPLGPSPKAVGAMHEALNNVNRYSDPGSWPLRHTLADHFGDRKSVV